VCPHYEVRNPDGELVDSTYRKGAPHCGPMVGLPPGLREGVTYMTLQEKTRMWIPARLALLHRPVPDDGPLVYDVELLEIR
jgi:peptidylprolyl isomerase